MYSKPITLFKGVDNRLRILVKTPEQRAVNLTDLTFTAELTKSPQEGWVGDFPVTAVDAGRGLAELVIPTDTLTPLVAGWYYLLFKYTDATLTRAAYSDDNYTVAIPVEVKLGFYDSQPE